MDTYRQIDLNYLQIPIMYRFQTERKKKSNAVFHAMGGPTIGLLLSGEQAYQVDTTNNVNRFDLPDEFIQNQIPDFSSTPEVEANEDYFNSLDFGIQLTVGANIYLNDNLYLSPDLRMYYGFTDINAEATRELYNDFEFSSNAFVGISVGIHYHMEQ